MSDILFSSSTPAPPTGYANIHWQTDGVGGHVSAYVLAAVLPIRTVSVNTTLTATDYTVVATVPSITITLYASPSVGQIYNVKNGNPTAGQTITVAAAVNIDTATSLTVGATASLTLQYDGSIWRIL